MKTVIAVIAAFLIAVTPSAGAASESSLKSNVREVDVPVLMYHRLLKHCNGGDPYTITPAALEEDLSFLRDEGYTSINVRQLVDFVKQGIPLPEKPVMLTFDDGYYDNLYYGVPLLEAYGMVAEIFVVGRFSERAAMENDVNPNYSYITWEQMEKLPSCVEIQNHTWDMHRQGARKGIGRKRGEERADYEMTLASDLFTLQDKIKAHTGRYPTAIAYPYGVYSESAFSVLRAVGLEAAFCSRQGINRLSPGDDEKLFALKRLLRVPGKSAKKLIKNAQ